MPQASSSSSEDEPGSATPHWVQQYAAWSRSPSADNADAGEAVRDGGAEADASEAARALVRRRLGNVPKLGSHSASAQARWAKLRRRARRGGAGLRAGGAEERGGPSAWCELAVKTRAFDRVVAAVVLLNGACVALYVDTKEEDSPRLARALCLLEHAFVAFFCLEAAVKAAAFGPRAMLASRNYRFELLLAAMGAADLWLVDFRDLGLQMCAADFGLNVLPLLRVVRFVKVFKTGELALISRCLFPAFGTLGHVALFLFIIIFMFSIPLVRLVGQSPVWSDSPEILGLFGSVPRAFFALLQMVINPDTETMRVVFERQPWTAPLFLVFVGMTTFTLMSIMFGSVTDCYKDLRDAQRQRDGRADRERKERIRANLLRELREADRREVGLVHALSGTEFRRQLRSPQFRGALQALEVDPEAVEDLLRLLEIDGGAIRYEEFVGALGLVGEPAKATHALWLRAHLAEDILQLGKRVESVEGQLSSLAARMEGVEERLTGKIDEVLRAMRPA
uniref:Ion transport domain-containing protein n=1 Tax=Alexandrium monilatum TaxID=311494 RepID=A0A7S4Q1X2_9DINO